MENAEKSKSMKIIAVVMIVCVLIFFMTIPAVMLGSSYQQATDQAAEHLDKLDNSDNFTPGQSSGDSMGQKIYSSFDGSNK